MHGTQKWWEAPEQLTLPAEARQLGQEGVWDISTPQLTLISEASLWKDLGHSITCASQKQQQQV